MRGPNNAWTEMALWMAFVLVSAAAFAEDVSVHVAVESKDVYLGQPFVFQIQIEGDDAPETPDLSTLTDFAVEPLGGRKNNSQSMTIVNGRVTQSVSRGYVLSYRLTAKHVGRLTIPSVPVKAGGRIQHTQPVVINSREPQQSDDFKLHVAFSKERCYVGEPVRLTVTWYISKDIRNFAFAVPALEDNRFTSADPDLPQDPNMEYFRVSLGSKETLAVKGQGMLDGRNYATLTFQRVLIPKETGIFDFPPATVAFEALVGYERPRLGRSLFDDFFSDDFFSLGRQGVYRNFVTPSNALRLEVLALPQEGRPANFSGLVGRYSIEADATPREVNVGDPITLTLRVKGSDYLSAVELPPLQDQPGLAGRFRIPREMASGRIEGNSKIFTQTIRAMDSSIAEIPPIELNYFDSENRRYQVARSDVIPLTVRATRVITAEDAEGREPERIRNRLTAWQEGIAHNYEGVGVLANQAYGLGTWFESPGWLAAVGAPPAIYTVLALGLLIRRRREANPELRRVRHAYATFVTQLRDLQARATASEEGRVPGAVLEALRTYLGSKLGMNPAALTFGDVKEPLVRRGVTPTVLAELQRVFDACEAYQYAGGHGAGERPAEFLERVQDLAKTLEKGIGK